MADDAKLARMRRIVGSLSPRERDALNRFYNLDQDIRQIAQALQMSENELHELKARVRRAFQSTDWLQ